MGVRRVDKGSGERFGELLRRHRLAAGLTQEELAERAGLSVRGVEYLERRQGQSPRRDTVELLAGALGLAGREYAAFKLAARRPPTPNAPTRPPEEPRRDLPTPLTSFVGREREVEVVGELLLRPEVRLLTLTGPGGVGKTRLALRVAEELRGEFRDGVFFVPLAPVRDPEIVAPTIATVLGVRATDEQPVVESLRAYLRDKRMLLLLDNFEQVVEAAPLVTELLAPTAGMRILVTSRALLRVRGEYAFPVPPLDLPDASRTPDAGALLRNEAMRLFADRARALDPAFGLAAENAPAVADLCRRVDGLPLAIELAAARVRVLPPEAMLSRLGDRLGLLVGGPRDLPDRQRTLRLTLEWSHRLLDEEERRLFRRLGVYCGGWTLDAVEALCSDAAGSDVLELLSGLVEKSLVDRDEPNGEPRFAMLETVREFAIERLVEAGEAPELQERHADYFLRLAERAEPELWGSRQREWLDRLEAERGNVRAALGWFLKAGDGERAVRLGTALQRFWFLGGHLAEGRWLETALFRESAAPTSARTKALAWSGGLACERGDFERAAELLGGSLESARSVGDKAGAALATTALSVLAFYRDDAVRAGELAEEGLALSRSVGNDWGIAQALNAVCIAAMPRGEFGRARAAGEESLALSRRVGDPERIAIVRGSLAQLALSEGEYQRAFDLMAQNLAPTCDRNYRRGIAVGLEVMAGIAGARGEAVRAARLVGAARAARASICSTFSLADLSLLKPYMDMARSRLTEAAFAAAVEEGRAMPVEEALEYARSGRLD